MRKVTLTVISYDDKILLGMKKKGFGEGKWNGFGGKPEEGEELIDCVHRETLEEAKINLRKEELELVGVLDFYFTNRPPDWNQQVHVYKASSFEGKPVETEEMKPQEFLHHEIPYDTMWSDDCIWLPHVLEGKKVKGSFTFAEDGSVKEHDLEVVEELL